MNTGMFLLALHCSKAPHNKLNTNIPPAATTKEERGYGQAMNVQEGGIK